MRGGGGGRDEGRRVGGMRGGVGGIRIKRIDLPYLYSLGMQL